MEGQDRRCSLTSSEHSDFQASQAERRSFAAAMPPLASLACVKMRQDATATFPDAAPPATIVGERRPWHVLCATGFGEACIWRGAEILAGLVRSWPPCLASGAPRRRMCHGLAPRVFGYDDESMFISRLARQLIKRILRRVPRNTARGLQTTRERSFVAWSGGLVIVELPRWYAAFGLRSSAE